MTTENLKPLLRQLNRRSRKSRAAALDLIRAMPHNRAVETLIALKSTSRMKRRSGLLSNLLTAASFVLIIVVLYDQNIHSRIMLPLSMVLTAIGYISLYLHIDTRYLGDWVFPLFAECDDARLIPPALSAWHTESQRIRPYLETCLVKNLPLLTREDAEAMYPQRRNTLRKLALRPDPALSVAVLDVLARIEDTAAIPTLERLLKRNNGEEVRVAGEACLARLRECIATETQSKVLLRASHNTQGAGDLLRTATPVKTEDERQLLRPGTGEENR